MGRPEPGQNDEDHAAERRQVNNNKLKEFKHVRVSF